MQRPENFVLDYSHPLARGLRLAGLGYNIDDSQTYYDSSPFKNHGQKVGPFHTGCHNGIPFIENQNASAINFPSLFSNTDANKFTFCCWVKYANNGGYPTLFYNSDYVLRGDICAFCSLGRELCANAIGDFVAAAYVIQNESAAIFDKWHHFAVVYNFEDSFCACYVNGELPLQTGIEYPPISLNMSEYDFQLMGELVEEDSLNLFSVKDFMVWENRALTQAEIRELANPSNITCSGMIKPSKRKYYAIRSTPMSKRYFRIGRVVTSW